MSSLGKQHSRSSPGFTHPDEDMSYSDTGMGGLDRYSQITTQYGTSKLCILLVQQVRMAGDQLCKLTTKIKGGGWLIR